MKLKFKFKKRYIVFGIIGVLIILFVAGLGKGAAIAQVETVAAKKDNIESTLSISGIVKEKNSNEVYPEASVKVTKVYVEKNNQVKKGQKILDLDLDALISSLNTLKLNKEIQELNYSKATLSDENGALSLVSTQNSTQQAKDAYDRAVALYEVGAISKVELDSAKTAYDNAKAGLNLAKTSNSADTDIMKKQIQLSEIQISDMQKQIAKLRACMVSPSDGVVSQLNAVEGSFATPSMPLYEIINNNELEIVSEVKEFTVKNLKEGQKVYITGDAFDGITYNGYIKSIAGVAGKTTTASGAQTSIEVITAIEDTETLLKSGLNVTCDVIISSEENVVTIPISAFRETKEGETFAFEVKDGILKQIPIEIGINSEDAMQVKSGLSEGQKVVSSIKAAYKDGMTVVERVDK